ncbi:hypothetical protein LCGC14_0525750 [marine sediment metagenome]|uniref:RNase NYN domain-containing protein n=1 Tax=marine sediment metagenome TaxID=412755 RepID=A0A0F9SFJ3_9ZZZZ|nr:hypothetical protein [bacterium]
MKKNELICFLENQERFLFKDKTILVDAANLILDFGGLENYINLIKKIEKYQPKKIYLLADASLKYQLTPRDTDRYLDLVAEGMIHECPSKTQADLYLIQMCVTIPNSAIISNDDFKEWEPKLVKHCKLIKFLAINGNIYFNINLKPKPNNNSNPNKITVKIPKFNSTITTKNEEPFGIEALYRTDIEKNKTIDIY